MRKWNIESLALKASASLICLPWTFSCFCLPWQDVHQISWKFLPKQRYVVHLSEFFFGTGSILTFCASANNTPLKINILNPRVKVD